MENILRSYYHEIYEDNGKEKKFTDFFKINEIQKIQDSFSAITGVAGIITEPDGTPITEPSNFCSLCIDIVRKTELGLKNCMFSDCIIGGPNKEGPTIQRCLSSGLFDGGVSIIIDGKHVANWLVGQVIDEKDNIEDLLLYADEIGVEKEAYRNALLKVNKMSKNQFENICNFLHISVQVLSEYTEKNISLLRENKEKSQRELIIKRLFEKLEENNAMLHKEIAERGNAEKGIIKLNNELEEKVKLRTRELEEKNFLLDKSNALFEAILNASGKIMFFALDDNYCYIAINYTYKEIIRNYMT